MSAPLPFSACIIVIGNEILSGQTADVNINFLSRRLQALGIQVREARIVLDIETDIVEAINACRQKYAYVITTGGIGPTHDDITAAAVARAFDLPVVCNREAAERLFARYPDHTAANARMKMSEMPLGASLIDNPLTAAPGFRVENVYVLAGIPTIMQAMFESLVPMLVPGPKQEVRVVVDQVLEGLIAYDLESIQKKYRNIEIGSYPSWHKAGDNGIRIVIKGYNQSQVEEACAHVVTMFRTHGGQPQVMTE